MNAFSPNSDFPDLQTSLNHIFSDRSISRLVADCQIIEFPIGYEISSARHRPSNIYFILNGSARLIANDYKGPFTAQSLAPGSFIGLASFLCVHACEYVIAADVTNALQISDELLLELFTNDENFSRFCLTTYFVAELISVVEKIISNHPSPSLLLRNVMNDAVQDVTLYSTINTSVLPSIERLSAYTFYASSNNFLSLQVGDLCKGQLSIIESYPPLPSRFLGFSPKFYDKLSAYDISATVSSSLENISSVQSTVDIVDDISNLREPEASISQITIEDIPSALDLGAKSSISNFRVHYGNGPLQESLACFRMLSYIFSIPYKRDSIEKILRDSIRRGQPINLQLLGMIGSSMGLLPTITRVSAVDIFRIQTPAFFIWENAFTLILSSSITGLQLASPKRGSIFISKNDLATSQDTLFEVLFFDKKLDSPTTNFGFSWFYPVLVKYKGTLAQVLLSSFVVQLFTLANPLLIQVIIDKVVSQRSLDTLQVLGVGLIVVTLLEGALSSLRTFLFTETTNRIDLRLGSEVIDHLLRLPLNYFDSRPVGELSTRIAELEKIRNFITGQAITTAIDGVFSLLYIIFMLLYSWLLTIVALSVLPLQIFLTFAGAPLFRRQYRDTAEKNALTQSHLVEVLGGIQTVKAQNVELVSRWKWQQLYSDYISRSFEKTVTGTLLNEFSQILQKLSQLLVLWIGAILVLKGELSLGQLVAFRIISGYVTQPLLRLTTLWQNIQELRVSFERLADVIDAQQESDEVDKTKVPQPPIVGSVVFEDVSFSFSSNSPLILNNISFEVKPSSFVAIVGPSGSGKSTLTKLISRLYLPTSGRIFVDNYDISKVELYSLRRQIGIVPQEPLLFKGSISENIALVDPNVSMDQIVHAAKISCAHDFIMDLPGGYTADVGERGSNLSGGQRQRIALARTLLFRPKLLILDEATSALDYVTESSVCHSLLQYQKQSTILFVTHRLSTIRNADNILMMHNGVLVESGTHEQLMNLKGSYYALSLQSDN